MRRSTNRFLTSHVGKLAYDDALVDAMLESPDGRPTDEPFLRRLRSAVNGAVEYQVGLGLDVVCDGELGKLGWMAYHRDRLSGFASATGEAAKQATRLGIGKDFEDFAEYYATSANSFMMARWAKILPNILTVCVGPVKYKGQTSLQEDINNLKSALAQTGAQEGFMNATSPGSFLSPNEYYSDDEAYLFALADAMGEEYRAIVDAGLLLQVDDPVIADKWGSSMPAIDVKGYYEWADLRIEALNRALRGIPRDRVRMHICWGSWHGPHSTDLAMSDLIPLLLKINVGAFSLEAANARHEHEFQAWRDVDLDGRILLPGVVGHATDTVEHPELVAWRIGLWADAVGRENVIASTDCGLGDRVHPQVEQAKLASLVQGAQLASEALWP